MSGVQFFEKAIFQKLLGFNFCPHQNLPVLSISGNIFVIGSDALYVLSLLNFSPQTLFPAIFQNEHFTRPIGPTELPS